MSTTHQLERRLALEKIEQERQAAYSQGYKDALSKAAELADTLLCPECGWPDRHFNTECQSYLPEAIRSLPIPEAQK